jgi:hypothetical protein
MMDEGSQAQVGRREGLWATERDARVEIAIDWIRAWMSALPACVRRYLRDEGVEALRRILKRVVDGEEVGPDRIPLPKGMRRLPFGEL